MKKMLYITHLSGKRINRLWMSALQAGNALGYEVHLACNMDEIDPIGWQEDCKKYSVICHHIDFDRNPLSPKNIKAYRQLKLFLKENPMDFIHCNTPVGGLLGRICAKQAGNIPVLYQAHGFHFWKGAPLKNWLLYYPVEKWMAKFTDVLLTINREDYELAKTFSLKKGGRVEYIPGVGVDVKGIQAMQVDKAAKRREFGIPENAKVMISVGELNENKNHIATIKAFIKLNLPQTYYLICGEGPLRQYLQKTIDENHMQQRIFLLGFRTDVLEYLKSSDIFLFPSQREGLPVSLMEAMAAGVPCIASKIRGNVDLLPEKNLFDLNDETMLMEKIEKAVNGQLQTANDNAMIEKCDKAEIDKKMLEIYAYLENYRSSI